MVEPVISISFVVERNKRQLRGGAVISVRFVVERDCMYISRQHCDEVNGLCSRVREKVGFVPGILGVGQRFLLYIPLIEEEVSIRC